MKNILKSLSILLFFALPLSAQAKNSLPEAVKQIKQKFEKYRPAVNHKRSLTRAAEVTTDSIINYFDDVAISKIYFTFDGEWYQTAYYNVSLEDDSLIKDKCEKFKITNDCEEIINYFGHDNEWYPLTRSVAYKEDDMDVIAYYSYKNEDWAIDTKYVVSVKTEEDGTTITTEILIFYDENGDACDQTTWQYISIDDKMSMEVYYGLYTDDSMIFPLYIVYEYDENNRVSVVTYMDEYEQVHMQQVYSYDDENWDFTWISLDADSIAYDRHKEKAVGAANEIAYSYEKIGKDGELVMDSKADVEIAEDGSYVITETHYDEDGVETYSQRFEKSYNESGNLVLHEIYSSTDGEWVLSNRETREYINDLLVKVTEFKGEGSHLYTTYYYYSDGTHTGVDKITMPETQQTDQYFDLQGRSVTASANGLVVRNGKVVLIRK